jgi:parvulin-like peptidyl-prolyl isomerase
MRLRHSSRHRHGKVWIASILAILPAATLPAQAPRGNGSNRPAAGQPAAGQPAAGQPGAGQRVAGPSAGVGDARSTEQVAAVVNGESITRSQLGQETVRRYGEMMLESISSKHLLELGCRKQGISVTQGDIEDEIERTARSFGLDKKTYLDELKKNRGVSSDDYRRDTIWPMLALQRLSERLVEITQEEFDAAYRMRFGEQVKCRMIMVSKQADADSLRARATEDPESFGELAKQHSEDEASAELRGFLPAIRPGMFEPEVEQIAFGLQPMQISEVIAYQGKFVILQCVERMDATKPAPQYVEQVRDQIISRLRDEKLTKAAETIFNRLKMDTQIVQVLGDSAEMKRHPGVAAFIDGKPITIQELTEACLAKHGKEILEGEINLALLRQALKARNLDVDQAGIDTEIARGAEAAGYRLANGQADVARWLKEMTNDDPKQYELYVADAVWPSVALKTLAQATGEVEVTEQELQKQFEAMYGARAEVLAIVLSDHRTAQRIWELARKAPDAEAFGKLAQQYSVEPISQSNYGKVAPIPRFGEQTAIETEAFRLKQGELSGIISSGDQFIILYCLGFTDAIHTDMQTVREELVAKVNERNLRIQMARIFDEMKANAQIDNYVTGTTQAGRSAEQAQLQQGRPKAGGRR